MKAFSLPFGLRPPSLEERRLFYLNEFDVKKALSWIRSFLKIDTGRDTGITAPRIEPKLITLRPPYTKRRLLAKLLKYLPEDVYYDMNLYRSTKRCLSCPIFFGAKLGKPVFCWWKCSNWINQELAFDIDPENFRSEKAVTNLRSFTREELIKAKEATISLIDWLFSQGFKRIRVIFSGRGFHVVVRDKKAKFLSYGERKGLTAALPRELQEAIDPWVTWGNIRLLRLPYSLHGIVGLKVTPISRHVLEWDVEEIVYAARPAFLE